MNERLPARLLIAGSLLVLVSAGVATWGHAYGPRSGLVANPWKIGDPADPQTMAGQRALAHPLAGRRHVPSAVVIPDAFMPLRFSHRLHVQDVECVDCHTEVMGSVRASDVNLPEEEGCLDCHDVEEGLGASGGDPASRCRTCHVDYDGTFPDGADVTNTSLALTHPPVPHLPTPALKFNHRVHVQKGVPCARCHGTMEDVDLATHENSLPVMGSCLDCHDGKEAPDACGTCHLTLPDGRLDTNLPGGALIPAGWYHDDAHDERWVEDHAAASQQGDGYCASCHTPQECVDCHDGIVKPLRIHPNNWVVQHATAARKNTPDCASCHRSQTFCVNCHQETRVVSEAPNQAPMQLRFHPEGWVGAANPALHHARQAQRNIRACVSCHTEDTCLQCHSTLGGLGQSPHPPGFAGSARCRRMLKNNPRVCSRCHAPDDTWLRQCW